MRKRAAAVTGAVGLILLALVPFAGGAGASPIPRIEDFAARGTARGAELGFTFDNSIFPRLIDVSLPFARTSMSSQAGGESEALASALYPGDLMASQSDQIPGILAVKYPRGGDAEEDTMPFPPPIGPISARTGSMKASAHAARTFASATTERIAFGEPGTTPRVEVAALTSTSGGDQTIRALTQTVATELTGIRIVVSETMRIDIATLRSSATAATDGIGSEASAGLLLGETTVTYNGATYAARIDADGLHLTGFPDGTPQQTAVKLERRLQSATDEAGIDVRTGTPVMIRGDGNAEASVGGLVITLGAKAPAVPVPGVVAQLVAMLGDQLPSELTDPVCFKEDIDPSFPLPLCLGANVLPGPGTGSTTTIALGNVSASAGASQAVPPIVIGGEKNPPEGGFEPPYQPPFEQPPVIGPGPVVVSPPQTGVVGVPRGPLYGLVARLSSAPLAFGGAALSMLAVMLGLGPSLRQWRSPGSR